MEGLWIWLQQLQFGKLIEMLLIAACCVLCITFHETCHGLVAYWLGDPTAKRAGRLTLNPLKHIDPFGLIMLAVAKFGWAKPVPVNMRNFQNPKLGMAVTALAGPVSNVLLAALAIWFESVVVFFRVMNDNVFLYYLDYFLALTAVLSCGLAVFNLIPVPPLDGSKILFAVMPNEWYAKLMRYERYGMIVMVVLLLTNVLDVPLNFMRDSLMDILTLICSWPFTVLSRLFL